ncbi:hypothetical protein L3Q65_00130 (plasmid) [Amycolatopsis sp. FU40]|uniref:hypothetical protein n=1 Tax=Amycolatopsis sp. FU40 TaxID=2914159 RepID=UPI001F3B5464|nr:hypothetical protein [Amycolatopsis sp. FU40]UKD50766.1 hypothetical protein L3Q65_00130 [Amycolatopsis sp. FU40]
MRTRSERREALARYLAAREEFDNHSRSIEAARAVGRPGTPEREDDDPEYQRLNTAACDARAAAPWWARFVYP